MATYNWTAGWADWLWDRWAWAPNHAPHAGDTATISTGYIYDWNHHASASYVIGNQDPTQQAPDIILLGHTDLSGIILGNANVVNYGNSTFNFGVGTGYYWEPNQGGYLIATNYGTMQGNISVNGIDGSSLNLLGPGSFGGTITFVEGGHSGSGLTGPSLIENNLLPNTTVNDNTWGPGPGPGGQITFSGSADASDVFNLSGDASLTLTQMQFLPSVDLQSDYASVTFGGTFSDDLQASFSNGVLTIQDLGLGQSLSLHLAFPTVDVQAEIDGYPGSWELFKPQHSGSTFSGLTLAYSEVTAPVTQPVPFSMS